MLFVYKVVVAIDPRSVQGHGHWLRSSFCYQLNGVRFAHKRSLIQLSHGPADFVKPTQSLHHAGLLKCRHVLFVNNKTSSRTK